MRCTPPAAAPPGGDLTFTSMVLVLVVLLDCLKAAASCIATRGRLVLGDDQ